jgi:hypothetical protein
VAYWAVARLGRNRERVALHCLGLAGTVYYPRLRERRVSHGRKIEIRPPLFPGYVGVISMIMDGARPAKRG